MVVQYLEIDHPARAHAGAAIKSYWTESPVPRLVAPTNVPLVHYTSMSGCFGILKEQALWATAAACLRDTSELHSGLRSFEDAYSSDGFAIFRNDTEFDQCIKESYLLLRNADTLSFVLSFCVVSPLEPASLLQWNDFGDNKRGAAIIFDVTLFSQFSADGPPSGGMVIYDDREKYQKWFDFTHHYHFHFKQSVRLYGLDIAISAYSHAISSGLATLIPFFKHSKLQPESEARLVFNRTFGRFADVEFRNLYGRTIPYLSAKIPKTNAGRSAITGVIIGPSFEQSSLISFNILKSRHPELAHIAFDGSGFPAHRN